VAELATAFAGFDVLVAMRERTAFPKELFDALPQLRLLVTTGMINRSIDLAAAAARGVVVCGTPWAADATVEVAWGLILGLAHAIPREDASLRAGRWQTTVGQSLQGKTLGVIGLGTIGSKVARLGQAFGMTVITYSPNMTPERALAVGVTAVSKEVLFESADVVTIHMILSERTRGLVGRNELERMKPSSLLVNTSRGPLVDEAALAAALVSAKISGAGIDVFAQEPIRMDNPLLAAPNTILTPHIGYVTHDVYRAWYSAVVEDIQSFIAGAPIRVLGPAPA
jgi:phosphoglycerate dehydrogenase-like enzyme